MPLQRHLDGSLSAGEAAVNDCDQLATNGVIHVVDKVSAPVRRIRPKQYQIISYKPPVT